MALRAESIANVSAESAVELVASVCVVSYGRCKTGSSDTVVIAFGRLWLALGRVSHDDSDKRNNAGSVTMDSLLIGVNRRQKIANDENS